MKFEPEINIFSDLSVSNILADDNSTGDQVGWWKEDHFNASDVDGDGLLNLTEFNEYVLCSHSHLDLHGTALYLLVFFILWMQLSSSSKY